MSLLTTGTEPSVSEDVQRLADEVANLKGSFTELKKNIILLLTYQTLYRNSMENNMRDFEEKLADIKQATNANFTAVQESLGSLEEQLTEKADELAQSQESNTASFTHTLQTVETNILKELQLMSNATEQHVVQSQNDHQALQTGMAKQDCGTNQGEQIEDTTPTPLAYYPISIPNYPTIPKRPTNPCAEIQRRSKLDVVPSGYYWVQNAAGTSMRVYCSMNRTCCGYKGEWVRVAYLDMTNSSHTCPSGFSLYTAPRRCGLQIYRYRYSYDNLGCVSVTYPSHGIEYRRVCGRVTGYQKGTTDAFYNYYSTDTPITSYYVDGVSITHGSHKKHIWTFAAANDELRADQWRCPCSRMGQNFTGFVPSYVGNDYFCDAGTSSFPDPAKAYTTNPIWDGSGCGSTSSCCSFNSPPWFCKPLPRPTTDNIELRVCRDQIGNDEDIHIERIEIYVG